MLCHATKNGLRIGCQHGATQERRQGIGPSTVVTGWFFWLLGLKKWESIRGAM
jgi:hypothetical protein